MLALLGVSRNRRDEEISMERAKRPAGFRHMGFGKI
jgi:hypothetical protein